MFRRNSALLVMVALVLTLAVFVAGCGQKSQPTQKEPEKKTEQPAPQPEKITLSFAHTGNDGSPYQVGLLKMKETLKQKTNGRVELKIFPSGQLGGERELVESLQTGGVDFAMAISGVVSNFIPEYAILDMPYIFDSQEKAQAYLKGPGMKPMNDKLQKMGIIPLAYITDKGMARTIMTKKPVKKLADLKGMKIRVVESPVFVNTMKAWGVMPTPIAFPEVYTSLQQGVVDGTDNPIIYLYTSKFHDIAKNVAVTEHMFTTAMMMMSQKSLDKLPADVKQVVLDAAKQAANDIGQADMDQLQTTIDAMKKLGVTFTDVDKSEFIKAVEPVYAGLNADQKALAASIRGK